MEMAKVTVRGQITIPIEIRKMLKSLFSRTFTILRYDKHIIHLKSYVYKIEYVIIDL